MSNDFPPSFDEDDDDDDPDSALGSYAIAAAQQAILNEFSALKTKLRLLGRTLPFDLDGYGSTNQLVYGPLRDYTKEDRTGCMGRFKGGEVKSLLGDPVVVPESVGHIVGDLYGRFVLYFEETELFIGWINETEVDILDISFEVQRWHH